MTDLTILCKGYVKVGSKRVVGTLIFVVKNVSSLGASTYGT